MARRVRSEQRRGVRGMRGRGLTFKWWVGGSARVPPAVVSVAGRISARRPRLSNVTAHAPREDAGMGRGHCRVPTAGWRVA